ncbi:hypothetical protein AB1I63_07775 [Streptococcus pneumoniae]
MLTKSWQKYLVAFLTWSFSRRMWFLLSRGNLFFDWLGDFAIVLIVAVIYLMYNIIQNKRE